MSQANLYAFGRLAWNPDLTSKTILGEWTRLTFGNHPKIVSTISNLQLESWRDFENYTGNLGLQTLTEITGSHYGPAVEASERNGWGQWHRSDEHGTGMDRTSATGTGYIGQYPPGAARVYENLADCPDDLLLFMHHVPYTYRLHSGKTVIQHIYDAHYEGAEAVARHLEAWRGLQGLVDEQRYSEVLAQLDYQAGHAIEWRDSITSWYAKTSGIPDAKGRVGKYPGRIEAESMRLEGYSPKTATPWETASGGMAVECLSARCSASTIFQGAAGWYRLRVRYFDRMDGISRFRFLLGSQVVDEWAADGRFPSRKLDGASSTVRTIPKIALRPGDKLQIEGIPGGPEKAPLDYLEIEPVRP
jgi:alpha-glucuronidase